MGNLEKRMKSLSFKNGSIVGQLLNQFYKKQDFMLCKVE